MEFFGDEYDNLDDAAHAAMFALSRQPRAGAIEYVTVLARDPRTGKFRRTRFATSGDAGSAPVGQLLRELMDNGIEPLAVVHNHPGLSESQFDPRLLSEADSAIGRGTSFKDGTPIPPQVMYLLANSSRPGLDPRKATDRFRTVVPRRASIDSMGHRQSLQETDPLLAMIPINEMKQFLARDILGRHPNDPRGLMKEGPVPVVDDTSMRDLVLADALSRALAENAAAETDRQLVAQRRKQRQRRL